jgi:hypothetical protein
LLYAIAIAIAIGTRETRIGFRKLSALLDEHIDVPPSMYPRGLIGVDNAARSMPRDYRST